MNVNPFPNLLDVAIDDEIQLLVGETLMHREDAVDVAGELDPRTSFYTSEGYNNQGVYSTTLPGSAFGGFRNSWN
jgi:hypothetical protein